MQYTVVTFTHTKLVGWAIHLLGHIRYLKKLIAQGKLQVSGPGVGTPVRSAQLVFRVTDRAELDQLVAHDPYSIHGLVASKTVNLWDVQWGDMEKPPASDPEGTKYFRCTYKLPQGADASSCAEKRDTYLRGLLEGKRLRAAGSYVNDPTAGLSILAVPSKEDAEEVMKRDPYVRVLGASYEVIEWDPKFGEFK